MRGRNLPRMIAFVAMALVCTAVVPASAQTYSDQYLFLKAIKERDGDKAQKLADQPGSVLVNSRDITSGETGLHIAVAARDLTWIHFLTDRGANPNIADKKGVTPLLLASQLGAVSLVEALISAKAEVELPNRAGETPLMLAVHRRDTHMMRVLLEAGADPDRTDNSGRSARDYAAYDGAGSSTLAEIARSEKDSVGQGAGPIYGPSF